MKYLIEESITSLFDGGLMAAVGSDFLNHPLGLVSLVRDQRLGLILEVTAEGFHKGIEPTYQAGTVRQPSETISLAHAAGPTGLASGVNYHGSIARERRLEKPTTVFRYSAHTVDIVLQSDATPIYTVEWVDNLPQGSIWPDNVTTESGTQRTETICTGKLAITIFGSGGSTISLTKALQVSIAGTELYLLRAHSKDDGSKKGRILYRGCPSQEFRDRLRACLSFVLGLPLVYYGHTEFDAEWTPTRVRSVQGFSMDGAMFNLYDLPPYPLCSRYENAIDKGVFGLMVNALFEKFETLDFGKLSWSYWYAVCAPVHSAAVHFGGLIEQLQRLLAKELGAPRNRILGDDVWKPLQLRFLDEMRSAVNDPELARLLEGKIASLNQAPAGLTLKRLLEVMGMSISEAETKAWKDRNAAAHGGTASDPRAIIRNSKLLRLMVHRLIAGSTYCSDRYHDYYSLGHPVRAIAEAIPGEA